VDDAPDRREDEVTRTDVPVTRPEGSGPATERVRIFGAETAAEITSELPAVSREDEPDEPDESVALPAEVEPSELSHDAEEADDGLGGPTVRLIDEPGDAGVANPVNPVTPGQTAVPTGGTPTELPHWTEPPTGQVPAVLSRDAGDEGSGISAPTWREEDADWVAHDEEFEPAMFGRDQVALGSLDETDSGDADRRPWEFDLASAKPGSPSPVRSSSGPVGDPITEPVPVVTPEVADDGYEPSTERPAPKPFDAPPIERVTAESPDEPDSLRPVDGPGVALGVAAVDLEDPDQPRPTGTARVGRTRRNGLGARMRAKRPDDVEGLTDSPLAAEPPGASVSDVPGAGRKRGGVAGLAAADRTAEREGDQTASTADLEWDEAVTGAAAAAAATTSSDVRAGGRRRLGRRGHDEAKDPSRPSDEGPTGGGPPARRRTADESAVPGPHQDSSPIGMRVGTGVAAAIVALLAFKLGTVPSLVLTVIVVTFAAGECFGVLRRAGYHPATLLGLVGTISLMVGAYTKGVAALPLILVLITVFTLIWYLFGIERGSPVAGTAATLLTVGWVSLLGSFAGLLLSPSSFPDRHGIAFLLGAIIATVANDIGALVIGGWLGSRALAPNISPNKTWEGLFGGAVFSILASTVIVGAIHPWSPSNAALLGVVVAVVAPIGDLCESLLKRDLRLKDMGALLPGHGGVLDRVDALLFVLPATYYLVRALNIA
jgi:CDP-diglyceride synthetase